MTSFLHKLSEHLIKSYRDKLPELCIIFPSRRAGIYFRKHLSSMIDKPVWSSSIYSIEEFIQENSDYILADDLVLRFELYNVFKKYGESATGGESFDKFYPWGGMLWKDFDEVDKNLVNTDDLFRVIKEIRDVEEGFSLPLEELEQFRAFWKTFSEKKLSETQKEFKKIWDLLGNIYIEYKSNLEKKNIAYEGMAIRKLVSEIENEKIKFDKYEKVIFAGFNSLSKSEERIISHLVKSGKTELFWDTDEYYINDDSQEAGKYLRKNFKSFDIKSPQWVENNLIGNQNDTIKIIGAPLNLGQAKALGDVLNDIIKNDSIGLENSAVILPDENLLLPVLYSIPKEVNKINVTMGFPLQNTSLYNLFELLKNLQLNKKPSGKSCVYYHKDVIEILMNPYVKYSNPEYIFNLVNYIKRYSIIYITPKKIIGFEKNCPELLKLIFQAPYSMNEIFDYIYKILNLISTKYDKSDNDYTGFELEYFYTVYEQMNRLKDIIEQYNESVEETTFWHILIESLGSIKIPFTGEPLEGLQIMGLLESRALDFDNIFLLSVNEGILPKGNSHSSFIPYNLRKAFKLPTYEDEDSISAYYFYRLIQRAKRIFLFYNTENDNLYSGEKSRFLLQLETELNDNSNIKVKNFICQAPVDKLNKNEISVAKSPALIERMKNEHHYSASDIINYINCELKFYFKKLAKLQEEEGVEEYFSPSTFGKIFHGVMQILYRDYVNKIIDEKAIENIKKALKSNYDSIFDEVFQSIDELKEMSSAPQGKNLLFKNVIKKLVLKVLDNELNEIPFRLIELEMKVSKVINVTTNGEQNEVELQGRIDRIDEKNGVKRIIDYKTGKVNNSGKSMDNNKMLEEIFENPFYKENFQASFYGYLYLSSHKENDIKMGIYPVKTLDKGIISIKNIDLSLEGYKNFENKLSRLFSEIFDFNQPFKQTTDTNRCEFCPYISICYRE